MVHLSSHYNYPSNVWRPSPVPADADVDQIRRLKQYWFTPDTLRSAWPKNYQPPATLAVMNVKETAIWLEIFANLKGWKEATTYAQSFKANGIYGKMLTYLTLQTLRSELEILKLGHRLEIIAAIDDEELTLMNPYIISIRADSENIPRTLNGIMRWKPSLANQNIHSKNVNDCLSSTFPIPPSFRDGDLINDRGLQPKAYCTNESDFSGLLVVKETGVQMSNKKPYCKMNQKPFTKSKTLKKHLAATKYPWIPPIKLPPAVVDFDGSYNRFDEFSLEFDKCGKNCLSSLDASSRTGSDGDQE